MNTVVINGRQYNLPSGNVSIVNNEIYVNGKRFNKCNNNVLFASVTIYGDIDSLTCDQSSDILKDK